MIIRTSDSIASITTSRPVPSSSSFQYMAYIYIYQDPNVGSEQTHGHGISPIINRHRSPLPIRKLGKFAPGGVDGRARSSEWAVEDRKDH